MAVDYSDYGDIGKVQRQRALAQMLLGNAMGGSNIPQQTGRIVPSAGIGNVLSGLGQALLSNKINTKADTEESEIKDKYRQTMDDYTKKGFEALQGKPEYKPDNMVELPRPAVAPDRTAAAQAFLNNPKTEALANKLLEDKFATKSQYGMQAIYGKDAKGKIVPMQLGSSGSMIQSQLPEGISEIAFPNEYKDVGGQVVALSRYGQQPPAAVVQKSASPDVIVSQTEQNKRQAKEPMIAGARAREEGQAALDVAQSKKQQSAGGIVSLLDKADPLIDASTGSMIGAGVDVLGKQLGVSTHGAQAIASLKTIQGALLSAMPRMEGPQSNYDIQNYKEAVGQIGDPTVPRETRKAALKTVREIQASYANSPVRASPAPKKPTGLSGWGIKRID